MYVVLFENGYALFEHSNIGKLQNVAKILKTNKNVQNVINEKLYDEHGNEITDYLDVTNEYIDLSNILNDVVYTNQPIELLLPPAEYAIYKEYQLIVKFNSEGNIKRLTFTEPGKYTLVAINRPCNAKTFFVTSNTVIIE